MITRFDHYYGGMDSSPDGSYVEYEDHVLALMEQDKRIATLGHLVDQAQNVLALVLDRAEEQKARIVELAADLAKAKMMVGVHTQEVFAAGARIAELEMFKQQWAIADAARVSAHRRIAELEAEFAQYNKGSVK